MTAPDYSSIRQLLYSSVSTRTADRREQDLLDILARSRVNNGLEGVSGLLLAQNGRYLQVLEGSVEAVGHIYERIAADPRHTGVVVVRDEVVARRSFGGWGMAKPGKDDGGQVAFRVERFLADAPPAIRQAFEPFDLA